jgi:hypothetical protein
MINNKMGQAWGIDMIVAFMIFLIGILIFFVYSVNYSGEAKESLDSLSHDGEIVLNNILSEGYPANWDPANNSKYPIKIGILSENKINETKLERFYDLAKTDTNYSETKRIFNINYDYYFFMRENMTIGLDRVTGIGKPGVTNLNNIDSSNLIKLTRFTVYKEKPTTVYLYIWN